MSNSSTVSTASAAEETKGKRCGLLKECHTKIPALCITLQMVFVTILAGVLAYLIVTHFLVN